MTRKFAVPLFLLLTLLLACTPAPAAPEPAPTAPPAAAGESPTPAPETTAEPTAEPTAAPEPAAGGIEAPWIFEPAADPILLAVTLDEAAAVEALIPLDGGTLTAVGADGSRYTLEIPADALLSETTIRMTPLQSFDGLPWGDSTGAAVQLEPAGLAFYNFATLTIEPAQTIPLDQQIFFNYAGEAGSVGLPLPVVDTEAIQMHLLHFSGYGVSKGLLADTEPVRQRLGGRDEARLTSLMSVYLQGERIRQQLGIPGEPFLGGKEFIGLFQEWEDKVVKVREAAAGESCAAGRLALQTRLGFERQKQLLGMADGSSLDGVARLMDVAGRVCLQEEYELCRDEHIIHRMIPVWLGLERQFQLLGMNPEGDWTEVSKFGMELTKKCLRFDLVFESTAVLDEGQDGGYTSIVKSTVPIKFGGLNFTFKGQSALVNESFEMKIPGCSVTSNRGGSTFEVTAFSYEATTATPNDPVGRVTDLTLIYFPGVTSESFSVTCYGATYSVPPSPLWTAVFVVSHRGELSLQSGGPAAIPDPTTILGVGAMPNFGGQGPGFVAEDWEIFGEEYFAKKEWQKEEAEYGIIEVGTFKLYHRPEK